MDIVFFYDFDSILCDHVKLQPEFSYSNNQKQPLKCNICVSLSRLAELSSGQMMFWVGLSKTERENSGASKFWGGWKQRLDWRRWEGKSASDREQRVLGRGGVAVKRRSFLKEG